MISVRCIVDNTAQRGSALWGEHGVAFAVDTPEGKLLFDTGQSGDVLVHNASLMGVHPENFDALALSHSHYDHSGGLDRFLSLARQEIPCYGSPSLFQDRFAIKDGEARSIGLRLSQAQLSQYIELHLSPEPTEILPGVWTSGEITGRSEFEGRSPNHFIRENGKWLPDPYRDDISLVLETPDGLVVVCGCCHAGLLNTVAHVRRFFHANISVVIGGMHLANASLETLDHAIDVLPDICNGKIPDLHPNHCTGKRAYIALFQAFGEQVQPCPAGTVLNFG
jgi:7,8-dihydropterin-6-yl-methyl-4-(beta-D-ribofuranosyl)aminobenzene 5'-phosphate synthase